MSAITHIKKRVSKIRSDVAGGLKVNSVEQLEFTDRSVCYRTDVFESIEETDDQKIKRRKQGSTKSPGVQRPSESTKAMFVNPANAKSAEPATRPFSCPTRSVRQPPILVVEDHDDTREMLCILLEGWGCRVVEACNGLEAVEAASRERPQLILMDSRLPFVDGLEATRRIRENRLLDQVKILALNGSGSPRYHADALAAGCNDSIEKPFDIERLRTYVVSASTLPVMRSSSLDNCAVRI
jgi:CheY-like chemotaxis protein